MATKLDKSIKRELEHQGRLYTITIALDGVKVVEKGKRNGKELSWASIISVLTATGRPQLTSDRSRCSSTGTPVMIVPASPAVRS